MHHLPARLALAVACLAAATCLIAPSASAAAPATAQVAQAAAPLYQDQLQAVSSDPKAVAEAIVNRWHGAARANERWTEASDAELFDALVRLTPDNLLSAFLANSYESVLNVLATGRPLPEAATTVGDAPLPYVLGSTDGDLVYTPLTPCRIADTRVAGGIVNANATRGFDMDGANFALQGGTASGCGIPYAAARAVTMNITVTGTTGFGWIVAWPWGATMPTASVLNYTSGWTVANTTVVPVVGGGGSDFYLNAGNAATHVIIDVLGYFAAPVATELDCTTVQTANVSVPVNDWTAIDANCPSGRTATGGGWFIDEGSLGVPGVWIMSIPNGNGWRIWVDNQASTARNVRSYVRCCRIPGR